MSSHKCAICERPLEGDPDQYPRSRFTGERFCAVKDWDECSALGLDGAERRRLAHERELERARMRDFRKKRRAA